MPINLLPGLIAFDHQVERGKLVRISSETSAESIVGDVLEFQYNPESLTRSRSGKWEPRKRRRGTVDPPQEVRGKDGQGSSALQAESETVSLKISFDATEAILAKRDPVPEEGILPQLAFLEMISLGKEKDKGKKKRAKKDTANPIRPDELLLILGKRVFPVVMTSLSITEQKFNPSLVPIRAEADIKLNVLEPVESAYNKWIKSAFDELLEARRSAAEKATSATEQTEISAIAAALRPEQSSPGSADAA